MEEEKSIIIYNQNKKQKLVLVVVIFIMCLVMLLFINQKEGYHPDEIFSYGSSNSRYENIFWSYREKTPMHHLIEHLQIHLTGEHTIRINSSLINTFLCIELQTLQDTNIIS